MGARLASLAVVALLSVGCSFLKPRSDPTRFFVLTATATATPSAPASLLLGLDRVELPDYLLRPELVTRSESNELKISEYDRWGEPLKDGFARILRRDLGVQLGDGHVVGRPYDPGGLPTFIVAVEVHRFERVGDDRVELDAVWTLRDGKSRTIVATHDARLRYPLTKRGTAAAVAAESEALAELAREIADAARSASGASPALRPSG